MSTSHTPVLLLAEQTRAVLFNPWGSAELFTTDEIWADMVTVSHIDGFPAGPNGESSPSPRPVPPGQTPEKHQKVDTVITKITTIHTTLRKDEVLAAPTGGVFTVSSPAPSPIITPVVGADITRVTVIHMTLGKGEELDPLTLASRSTTPPLLSSFAASQPDHQPAHEVVVQALGQDDLGAANIAKCPSQTALLPQ